MDYISHTPPSVGAPARSGQCCPMVQQNSSSQTLAATKSLSGAARANNVFLSHTQEKDRKMFNNYRSQLWKLSAVVLALALLVFAAGCKKKVPPPPPPPPAPAAVTPPAPPPTPGKPSINSFTAEPSTIQRGQSATLRWSISNAADMRIDQGIGAVQSNASRQVFPSAS